MTVVSSYEAQFKPTGVEETKNGFAEIAKAASLADRQARVNSQNLKDYAKSQIQTEKEKARAAEMAAKAQAKASAQSDAMWKKVGAGAAVAAAAVVKFGLDSYKAYQQYAGAVRDVALASGASAEQSSIFLQVLDDFEISADDVTKAMKAMTKNGMTPTIDTLAQLADKYVAIEDPMKRNEFLMKNLGKAGLQWANALSQGGDALRASSEEVNKSLILTDEQIKKAEMARLAVDAWADAWEGFKISIGGAVGNMIAANAATQDMAEKFREATGLVANKAPDAFEKYKQALDRAAASEAHIARDDTVANLQDLKASAEESANALKELSSVNAKLISDAISIQEANDKYSESQNEILATIEELQAKKLAMNASEKDAIAEINSQIEEQKEAYAAGAAAFGEAQGEKLVMMALEKIALQDGVAGYSDAEAAKAKLLLDTAGIAEESAFRQALAFETAANALANGTEKAEELHELLRMMSEHGWTIDVAVNVKQQLEMGAGAVAATGAAASVGWQGGQWAGGTVGSFAGGGKAGGWGMVGDRPNGGFIPGVSELIFGNAHVFNSQQSAKMLKSGMFGNVPGFALGGQLKRGAKKPQGSSTSTGSGGSGGSLSTISEQASTPVEMGMVLDSIATETATEVQHVASQVEVAITNMTAQIEASNNKTQSILERVVSVLLSENPRAVGKQVAFEVSRAS